MRNAIYELKSIAAMAGPEFSVMIEDWIIRNVGECHSRILLSRPDNEGHKTHQIKAAIQSLGELIAKNSNSYPTFKKEGNELICRMSALYFKNEFGR